MPIKGVEKIKFERTLRDIAPGNAVYTPPWALVINSQGVAYLDLTQPTYKRRFGDFIMCVKRLSFREGDYEVDVGSVYKARGKEYKWVFTNIKNIEGDEFAYLGKIPNSVLVEKKSKKPVSKQI